MRAVLETGMISCRTRRCPPSLPPNLAEEVPRAGAKPACALFFSITWAVYSTPCYGNNRQNARKVFPYKALTVSKNA